MLNGCLAVPLRTPKAIKGPAGSIKKLDMKFLAPGLTSRSEVLDRLGAVNAAPGSDRFLWARWKQSTWAVAFAAGGPGAAVGGAGRLWGSENLLVQFKPDGTVAAYRRVSDGNLARELRTALKDEPAPSTAEPFVVSAEHRHHHSAFSKVDITLSPTAIRFDESANPAHSFEVPPESIASLDSALHDADDDNVMEVEETLHFRGKTPVGTKVSLRMNSSDFLMLLRYINQYCPNAR